MKIAKYFFKGLKKCFVITMWPYMVNGCHGNYSPLDPISTYMDQLCLFGG
jgi:hypothetical protein